MKKIILSVVVAAFVFGCAGSEPATESPAEPDVSALIAELDGMLAGQNQACVDRYFAESETMPFLMHSWGNFYNG